MESTTPAQMTMEFKRRGRPAGTKSVSKKEKARMLAMRKLGMTNVYIASELGRTPNTVAKALKGARPLSYYLKKVARKAAKTKLAPKHRRKPQATPVEQDVDCTEVEAVGAIDTRESKAILRALIAQYESKIAIIKEALDVL